MPGSEFIDNITSSSSDSIESSIYNFTRTPGLSDDQVADCYDKWANSYDSDLKRVPRGYNATGTLARVFGEYVKDEQSRAESLILDIGCGTGAVAEEMKKLGFRRLHGLDGSPGMVEKARAKDLYESLFVDFITKDPVKSVKQGSYDGIVSSGSFMPNHLGPDCLKPLGDLLKSDGVMAITMRKSLIQNDPMMQKMQPAVRKLEDEGYWKVEKWEEFDNYLGEETGVICVIRKI